MNPPDSPSVSVQLVPVQGQPGRWTAHVGPVALPMSTEHPDGKPRVRDIDFAAWLGFKTPRMIRKLIKRMEAEGKLRGTEWRSTVERQSAGRDGSGTREYTVREAWLTREQALLVATQSSTPRAWGLVEAMARVFDAFLDGRLALVAPPAVGSSWGQYHDRILLNRPPRGYFSVFREMSEAVLIAIQNGLVVDEHTVPDISVGMAWAHEWAARGYERAFGPARRHPHKYPPYYPQAGANDIIEAWIYPLAALSAFREWFESAWPCERLEGYLRRKVANGSLPAPAATRILTAFGVPQLPPASQAPPIAARHGQLGLPFDAPRPRPSTPLPVSDSDSQTAHLERVTAKLADAIVAFCQARLARLGGEFYMHELLAWVRMRSPSTAPDSPSRVLRLLRRKGRIEYAVVSRCHSRYRVAVVR